MSPASGQTRAESPALFGHHRTHPRCCACLRHSSRCRDSRDLYCSGGRRRQSWRGPSPDEHCSTAGDGCRDAALGRLLVSPCGSDADDRSRPCAAREGSYRTHHDSRPSFGPRRLDGPARGNHRSCRSLFLPGHCVSSEAWGRARRHARGTWLRDRWAEAVAQCWRTITTWLTTRTLAAA